MSIVVCSSQVADLNRSRPMNRFWLHCFREPSIRRDSTERIGEIISITKGSEMKRRFLSSVLILVIFTGGFSVVGSAEDQNAVESTQTENQQVAMEANIVTKVFLPIALAVIMLGMGLSLTADDFKRVMIYPRATLLGMLNQLILLPIIAFVYAKIFPLSPELAVGLMILAVCPGGVTSNLISHVSKGDTALSITLTAISGVITVITIPFILSYSLEHFIDGRQNISLPIGKTIIQIFVITVIPVSIGMSIRSLAENFANKMGKPVKIISVIFFVLVLIAAILSEKDDLPEMFKRVGIAALALNVTTMLLGFLTSRLTKLDLPQSITISIESGIQNGTLAIVIATSILNNTQMSITPAIYSLLMFVTGGFMMFYFGTKNSDLKS